MPPISVARLSLNDELSEAVENYKDKFESVKIAEPLLGEVGSDATVINADKEAVAKAITDEAVKAAEYDSLEAAEADGTAFVFMGHGTSHVANVSYNQILYAIIDRTLQCLIHVINLFTITGLYMVDNDLSGKCSSYRPVWISFLKCFLNATDIFRTAVIK